MEIWRWSQWLWCMLVHVKDHVFVPREDVMGTTRRCSRCGGSWEEES